MRVPVDSREALSLAYTPGVAEPCLAIRDNPELSFTLTRRWNTVPVITDGTAVLGLGDIGPEAGMPVMEGTLKRTRRLQSRWRRRQSAAALQGRANKAM